MKFVPSYIILICGFATIGLFYYIQFSPYYSIDNLKNECCTSLFQVCKVSGSCYNYFKYWNPNFDQLLKIKKPYSVSGILWTVYYLNWVFVNPNI